MLKELFKMSGLQKVKFSYDYEYLGLKDMIDETRLKINYIVKVKNNNARTHNTWYNACWFQRFAKVCGS
jgi:hypothetical protein